MTDQPTPHDDDRLAQTSPVPNLLEAGLDAVTGAPGPAGPSIREQVLARGEAIRAAHLADLAAQKKAEAEEGYYRPRGRGRFRG